MSPRTKARLEVALIISAFIAAVLVGVLVPSGWWIR